MNYDQINLLEHIAQEVAIEPEHNLNATLHNLSKEPDSVRDKVNQAYHIITGLKGVCAILGIQYDTLKGDHAGERMGVTAYRFVQQLTST